MTYRAINYEVENERKPGGRQLHNLHCSYPACDRKQEAAPQENT